MNLSTLYLKYLLNKLDKKLLIVVLLFLTSLTGVFYLSSQTNYVSAAGILPTPPIFPPPLPEPPPDYEPPPEDETPPVDDTPIDNSMPNTLTKDLSNYCLDEAGCNRRMNCDAPEDVGGFLSYTYLTCCLCWDPLWANILSSIMLTPEELFAELFKFMLPFSIAIGIGAISLAGYSYMTSQGQPDKVKEAGEKLTGAITGVLFVALSLWILKIIINLFIDPGAV